MTDDQSPTLPPGLLTLKEISDALNVKYSQARTLAQADGVPALIGAQEVPGVQGLRYPASAVPIIRALLAAQTRKELTPQTAAVWLKLRAAAETDGGNYETVASFGLQNLATLQEKQNEVDGADVAGLLKQAAETLLEIAARQPIGNDRLLTAVEASEYLACSPRGVSRFVRPVRRGRYRLSDVQAYLAGLAQQ